MSNVRKAKTPQKPPPVSAESLRRQTAQLNVDVALVNAGRGIERAIQADLAKPTAKDDPWSDAYCGLEYPLHETKVWSSIVERLIHEDYDEENAAHVTRVVERLIELVGALYEQYDRTRPRKDNRTKQATAAAQIEGRPQ
jgi:hypothetical protein